MKFSGTALALVAAALFISAAMTVTGLDKRIALVTLSAIGTSTRRILIGTIVVTIAATGKLALESSAAIRAVAEGARAATPMSRPCTLWHEAGTIRGMKSLWSAFVKLLVLAVVGGALLATVAVLVANHQLPSLDALTTFRNTSDYVPLREFPRDLTDAVVAIEDERFYLHDGIDYIGVIRAGVANLSDELSQGASTITMQVARNFFLSREKTYTRKLYEVLLSYRIEHAMGKDEILELYMNKIYLGQGAYGFADAARTYFGKSLGQLTLAECAMLAGLPKAPSANNPVANPRRARQRQAYILHRMLELGKISRGEYDGALLEPMRLR